MVSYTSGRLKQFGEGRTARKTPLAFCQHQLIPDHVYARRFFNWAGSRVWPFFKSTKICTGPFQDLFVGQAR